MRFFPGDLVSRRYAGHISLNSQPGWTPDPKRVMWYENDVGIVLEVGVKLRREDHTLVKVLLPTGFAYIESHLIKEVDL